MSLLPEPSEAARAFGERAAEVLGCKQAARPIVAGSWAVSFDRHGAEVAGERLRTKVAFDRTWNEWRDAARALAENGARHFGPNWPTVAADLDSNRIRLLDGADPRSTGC